MMPNKFFKTNSKHGLTTAKAGRLPKNINPQRVNSSGGANPIANKVPYDPKNPPLNDGTFFTDKKIFNEMPYGVNDAAFINSVMTFEIEGVDEAKRFNPNLFGSWVDIYNAFKGTYQLKTAPDEILRLESAMFHLLFLIGRCALMKVDDNDWLIGNYSMIESDNYGRIIKGQFIPWNWAIGKPDEKKVVTIDENNNDTIVNMVYGEFGIPPFLIAGYFVNMRNMLYAYKNINLRLSVLNKIIGLDAKGKKIMKPFLDQIFNLDPNKFPNPIQIVDVTINEETGEPVWNFTDLGKDKQIDIGVEYKGNEINLDIEGVTKELFRVVGLRTDLASKSGVYQERSNEKQINQTTSYFDVYETSILRSFRNFEMDFKNKFGIELKFVATYQDNQEQKAEEKHDETEDNPDNL